MKILKPLALILFPFCLYSCNDKKAPDLTTTAQEINVAEMKLEDERSEEYEQTPQKNKKEPLRPSPETAPAKQDWDKKIIRNATLNVEVKDYKSYYAQLKELSQKAGGYISGEQQSQSDYKIESVVTIRVPVDQFDNTISSLAAGVVKLNERKISSEDVTTEVVDTKSRMEAKRQVRDRYLDLLKQARTMEDILKVQSEVNDIQEEIEAGAGRIEYLNHASAYSTIVVTLYQVLNASAAEDVAEPGFLKKISEAFGEGWQWVGNLFVGFVSIWPIVLVILSGIFLYKRFRGNRTHKAVV